MHKVWIRTALLNFFIAACLGTLLRFAFVIEIPWLQYRHFQHAHSHVAMLGWVYLALYALLIHTFLNREQQKAKIYQYLFWLTQGTVIGMLFTFPFMGYAGLSIIFSTLHILLSYVFMYRFWRDLKHNTKPSFSKIFIKAALLFMLLSTLSLWGLGIIIAIGLKGSAIYYMAVQFFLHFQFNGWFLFSILGLLFHWLEKQGWSFSPKQIRTFFTLLVSSSVLTYALAVAWSTPLPIVFGINSAGVSLQLAALIAFFILMKNSGAGKRIVGHPWVRILIFLAIACFAIKIVVQAVIIIPFIAKIAYTIRNFVIGFIHLINLGIISCFILGYSIQHDLLSARSKTVKVGLVFFLVGLLGSELLLFLQGTLLWGAMGFLPLYYEILFGISSLIALGLGVIQVRFFITTKAP